MPVHKGSGHCGKVRFELDPKEALGPYFRCSCSLCAHKGAVIKQAGRDEFWVTDGEDPLSVYRWNTGEAEHCFCQHCGIYNHHVMRGATAYIGVNMACIEGFGVYAAGEVVVGGGAELSTVSAPHGDA